MLITLLMDIMDINCLKVLNNESFILKFNNIDIFILPNIYILSNVNILQIYLPILMYDRICKILEWSC